MAIVSNPRSALIARLEGVHLFHFEAAPCAQRVRFALAERGLTRGREVKFDSERPQDCTGEPGKWVSRHVSLIRKDHITPQYAAIHPHMVVPALVHDGVLHIESMDIVRYVDDNWPGPGLLPEDPQRRALSDELVIEGKAAHRSIRFVSFRWGLRGLGKLSAAEEARLLALEQENSPEKMGEFYTGFDQGTIPEAVFLEHLHLLETGYARLESLLEDGRAFLTGDSLTPADIIWSLKVLRIGECGYPFARNFPALHAWFRRISARPAFREGVMEHNKFLSGAMSIKASVENFFGKGLKQVSMVPTAS